MRSFRGYVTRYVMIRFRSLTSFFFTSFSFNSGIIWRSFSTTFFDKLFWLYQASKFYISSNILNSLSCICSLYESWCLFWLSHSSHFTVPILKYLNTSLVRLIIICIRGEIFPLISLNGIRLLPIQLSRFLPIFYLYLSPLLTVWFAIFLQYHFVNVRSLYLHRVHTYILCKYVFQTLSGF